MASLPDHLPAALERVETRPLFTVRLDVDPPQELGDTPVGERRVAVITGGVFEGAEDGLRGRVLPGGSDWLVARDGVVGLDVRLVLETDDGERIGMTYRGVRRGPAGVMARLAAGEPVDPSDYYLRAAVAFETGAARFQRLNHLVAVATGHRYPDGPLYRIFEVL